MYGKLAPFVPTPVDVVFGMLNLPELRRGQILYDLGCGDGRIPILAVKYFGAKEAIGVELDSNLVKIARENLKRYGVEDRVCVIQGDISEISLSDADVTTLYLLPKSNARLRKKLENELSIRARVVSHDFPMRGWKSSKNEVIYTTVGYRHTIDHRLYLYLMSDVFNSF